MLYIHNRSERLDAYDLVSTEAIRAAFFSDTRSAAELSAARQALTELHRNRLWLACDCCGTTGATPMIGPRDGRGGMHPFRFGEVRHADECAFAGEIRSPSVADEVEDVDGPILGPWNLESLVHHGPSGEDQAAGLNRLLRTALHQLGYERLHVSSFNKLAPKGQVQLIETPFARLRQLGAQDMGHGITFAQVGCTFLPGINRTYGNLRKLAAARPGQVTSGLFIGVIEEVVLPDGTSAGALTSRDTKGERRTVPILGSVHAPPGDNGTHGPYWALGLITQDPRSRQFRLADVTLMHALDRRTLLPIHDAEYRPLGQMLLEQLSFWSEWKKLQAEVEIQIPLFPCNSTEDPGVQLVLACGQRVEVLLDPTGALPVPGDPTVHIRRDVPMDDSVRRRLTGAVATAQRTATG